MENFVVTFARGFGTGGKEIASLLAKDLFIQTTHLTCKGQYSIFIAMNAKILCQ